MISYLLFFAVLDQGHIGKGGGGYLIDGFFLKVVTFLVYKLIWGQAQPIEFTCTSGNSWLSYTKMDWFGLEF